MKQQPAAATQPGRSFYFSDRERELSTARVHPTDTFEWKNYLGTTDELKKEKIQTNPLYSTLCYMLKLEI